MARRLLIGGLVLGGLGLSKAEGVELVEAGAHTSAKQCPLGARCKDSSYEAPAYPCPADSSLKPGEANIIEFRCNDGQCMRTRGLCNGRKNCADGSDEEACDGVLNTTSAKAMSSPYDCFAEYGQWRTAWTALQKTWCCNQFRRGCDEEDQYDCEEDPQEGGQVDKDKKQWCCQHRGRWCGKEHTGFDCKDWTSRWNNDKKSYCCKVERRGCTLLTPPEYQPAYDCVQTEDWVTQWTLAEKDWCCAARGVNCPDSLQWALANHKLYDCKANDEWPKAKKVWCCKNEKVACSDEDDMPDKDVAKAEDESTEAPKEEQKPSDAPAVDDRAASTLKCADRDTTYDPLDMEGHPMKIVADVSACQDRCAAIEDCAHFSFWETERHCHVHGTAAVSHSQPNFLSGPPTCDKDGRRYHQLATAALRQRVCFQNEVAFIPYDSVIHASAPRQTPSPVECQALCKKTEWCAHFTFTVLDSMCHLTDGSAVVERNVLKSMAGPNRCQDLVTFSVTIDSVDFAPVHANITLHDEIKNGVKHVVTEAAGSYDEHYSELTAQPATAQPATSRRLGDVGDQAYPLLPESYQEIVFSEGDSGELVVTTLIGLPEDIPSRVVREVLTKSLSKIEVGLAKFIAKSDAERKVSHGIIHIRMLKPPSLVPYTSKKEADVEAKFALEGGLRRFGAKSTPTALLVLATTVSAFASFLAVKLIRSATVVADAQQRVLVPEVPHRGYACLGGACTSSEEEVA